MSSSRPQDPKNIPDSRRERIHSRRVSVVWLWLFVAAILPCSAVAKSSEIPDPIHACSLLTPSEATTLAGAPVGEPRETHKEQKSSGFWMSMCNYDSDENRIGMGITLKPHGKIEGGAQAYAAHEAELKKALGSEYKLEPVAGIGDRSGWDESTKQLTVFQGPLMVIVGVVSPGMPAGAALALCKKIATAASARLPRF